MKRAQDSIRFIYPEQGTVAVFLGIMLGYFLVEHTTGQLTRTLQTTYPTLFPEPVHTLAQGLLAFVSIMALFREGHRQYKANPRVFMSREEVYAFHSHKKFEQAEYLRNLAITVVGTVIVIGAWSRFIVSYEGTVRVLARVYITSNVGVIDPMNVLWGVLFVVGFVIFAVGLDQLVVALWQDMRFQLFERRFGIPTK